MFGDNYHNALGGNSADQLRAYVSRVERLEEEIKGLNDGKREIYQEAKACGFVVRTLKKLIARRRKDRSDVIEEDDLLDLYEQAMTVIGPRKKILDPLEE